MTENSNSNHENDDAWLDGPEKAKDPKVGYGRPPKHTQFKKGSSGNSKGRPKKSRNVKTVIRDVINTRVEVTLDGRKRSITVLEAVLRRLAARALSDNDRKAAEQLVNFAMRVNEDEIAPIDANANPAEDEAIINSYLDRQIAEREANERSANHKRKGKADD